MRPDTRSFSFTWMKGQSNQNKSSQHQKLQEDEPSNSKNNIKEQSGADGGSSSKSKTNEQLNSATTNNGDNWGVHRGSSGSRLRKLSNSLVKLRERGVARYSNMNDNLEDESQWQRISEEPFSLEDQDGCEEEEDEVQMDVQISSGTVTTTIEPDIVVTATAHLKKPIILPFQPLENGNQSGGENAGGMSLSKRLNKTVQDVKASLGNFSQRFRKSTRRRYRMPSTPSSVASPATRKILGRTPTKLYSPFGIETPINVKTPKRLTNRPSTPRLTRKSMVASLAYSPSNNFRRDLDEARRGMRDFQILSRDITRRSVRF